MRLGVLSIKSERRRNEMITLNLFVIVLGLVCLLLAATKAPEPVRVSWGWLGMFLWLLSLVVK